MMTHSLRRAVLAATISFGIASLSHADPVEQPTGWRTDGTGAYSQTNAPLEWSAEKNVVWKTPLPDWSTSQPAVGGDRAYICSEPDILHCIRLSDGELLWSRTNSDEDAADPDEWRRAKPQLQAAEELRAREDDVKKEIGKLKRQEKQEGESPELTKQIADLEAQREKINQQIAGLPLAVKYAPLPTHKRLNGYSTATPTTDGDHVWAVFGNAVVACYDRNGERVWIRKMPDRPNSSFGHSSSPLLLSDKLIVNVEDTVALDPLTGREIWRTRYGQSWGSPVKAEIDGEEIIVLANGRFVRGSDGTILGRAINLSDSSPVVQGRNVYYIQNRGGAVKLPATLDGEFEVENLWKTDPPGQRFFASPVIHDGLAYTVSSNGILSVIDLTDGKVVESRRMNLGQGTMYPSLVVVRDAVLVSSDNGKTVVFKAGRDPKELHRNELPTFMSSPIVHNDRILIRTREFLWCLGEK